jgi:hypothetical protein
MNEYAHWNGRYTSNALVLASPLAFGIAGYRVAAALGLVGIAASSYLFVSVWAQRLIDRRTVLTCAMALTLLYTAGMPSIGEGVYWYTSAATYSWWIIAALLHGALVVRYTRAPHPGAIDRLGLAVAGLLLVAVDGFNEVIMLMMIVIYAAWAAVACANRSTTRRVALAFLLIAIVSGMFVLFSPGNAVRQSLFVGVRHQLPRSIAKTMLQTLRFNGSGLWSGALQLASLLFVPVAMRWTQLVPQDARTARHARFAFAALLMLLVPIATFPAYWETGTLGQHRTADVAFFAFLVIWFAAIPFWLSAADARGRSLHQFAESWRSLLAVMFVIAIGLTGNTYTVGTELLNGELRRYDAAMHDRYAQLERCRSDAPPVCELTPIPEAPASFSVVDVGPSAAYWVNVAYARYFATGPIRAEAGAANHDVRH